MTKEKLIEGILKTLAEKKEMYAKVQKETATDRYRFLALGFELAYQNAIVEIQCACLGDLDYRYKKEGE